jgi:hypothetical protein
MTLAYNDPTNRDHKKFYITGPWSQPLKVIFVLLEVRRAKLGHKCSTCWAKYTVYCL